jgi:lysozyme
VLTLSETLQVLLTALLNLFRKPQVPTPVLEPVREPPEPVQADQKSAPVAAPVVAKPPPPAPVYAPPVAWLSLCLPLTKASESCELTAYPDPASGGDPWTCGWGSTGSDIKKGTVWTQEHADSQLTLKLEDAADQVDRLVKVPLTPAQKAALVDFTYNEGAGELAKSTLLKVLNNFDYLGAADEFAKWDLAAGKVMPGLETRRARERSLFVTGAWK